MLVWIAFFIGCVIGWYRAGRRGGNLGDRLQYALAHGIPLALATLAVSIFVARVYAG